MESPKLEKGKPVSSLSIEFEWHEGIWKQLFDKHVKFIQQDILRALASNKLVVYLSCPISSRGGSYFATNVEIANFTVQRLLTEWGPRFWFLNPAQYQMESTHGLGLIRMHAHDLDLETRPKQPTNVDELTQNFPPVGGDYMRMWTRVLAEDDSGNNLGGRFSAFYFMSPSDVRAFFSQTGAKNITAGVESYFGSKCATDSQFRDYFTQVPTTVPAGKKTAAIEAMKQQFFLYYAVRGSASFSKGSHDEWNIWRELNARRLAGKDDQGYGMGSQIAGYFEGLQIDPGAAEAAISPGYAVAQSQSVTMAASSTTTLTKTAPLTDAVRRLEEH